MGKCGAEGRARQALQPAPGDRGLHLAETRAVPEIGSGSEDEEQAGRKAEHRQHRSAMLGIEEGKCGDEGEARRHIEPLQHADQVATLPGKQRPEGNGNAEAGSSAGRKSC